MDKKQTQRPISTKSVSAGSRIYYFDVRSDKNGQRYVTMTEMAKNSEKRSTIFLHAEDYDKVLDALKETIEAARIDNN
ncbi:MAG: PUR family DNA/RNA-binding protein [Bacteroidales bacterium]|nr:PUR family DNA/RNA-binding protein [Bacteroidales bacterium]